MSSQSPPDENPPYVVAAVTDLFFTTRLRAAANDVPTVLDFASDLEEVRTRLSRRTPRLVLVDLNARDFDAIEVVRSVRDGEGEDVPVVGFFSHVDTELKQKAEDAGCNEVLPRRAFVQRIPELLTGSADLPQPKDI